MTLRPRILQVDVPADILPAVTSFWAGALSADPVDAPGGFVHLHGATSVVEVHLQSIGAGPPRYHLDLVADDRDTEVARLVGLGANQIARFRQEGYTVLEDPAGLLLCVIDPASAEPNTLAPRAGDRGYLDALFVDVPADLQDAEVAFWSTALDAAVRPPPDDAPQYTGLTGVAGPGGGVSVDVQRVDAEARYHVDLSAPDVDGEVARLVELGATEVARVEDWVTLHDPAGNLFCVVPTG